MRCSVAVWNEASIRHRRELSHRHDLPRLTLCVASHWKATRMWSFSNRRHQ